MLIRNLAAISGFILYFFVISPWVLWDSAFSQEMTPTDLVIPLIKNIAPNPVVASSSRQNLKITGSGFSAKSQVILKSENKTFLIPPARTKFLNSGLLEIFVNVSTQPSSWTVEVKIPEGGLSKPFQFKVISKEKAAELIKKEAKKFEVEQLEKKAAELNEDIKEKKVEVEIVKEEAAKALLEKKVREEKALSVQEQAQKTREELEAAKKEAEQTKDEKIIIKAEELEKGTARLEKEAQVEKEKLVVAESEAEKAQKKAAESEAAFKRMQDELARINKVDGQIITRFPTSWKACPKPSSSR